MNSQTRYSFIRAITAPGLVALVLALTPSAVHAEARRTGGEPWYQQTPVDARQRAQALFAQAVDKHRQLLRRDAMELYEQALALWDNPDIRWNLALVLEDLGQYLRAYQQLEGALRWEAALGAERLREVRDRMRALETQRLSRIEAYSQEPGVDVKLDGQPWLGDAGRWSMLVLPGEHYIAASKPGYFPVSWTVYMKAGQRARVALRMDGDRLIETRRWTVSKPWTVVAAGVVVTAVGAGLERQAIVHRDAAAKSLPGLCDSPRGCTPATSPAGYDRAVTDRRIAIGAFVAGGTTLAVGLTMAWINQLQVHRTEAHEPARIEVTPIVSAGQAGISARLRF